MFGGGILTGGRVENREMKMPASEVFSVASAISCATAFLRDLSVSSVNSVTQL